MFLTTITSTFDVNPFCAPGAAFFGYMGGVIALTFANLGAAYGTAKSGVAVAHLGIVFPGRSMRGLIPCVMAGILGIYGLIIASILANSVKVLDGYSMSTGHAHLAAGLTCGFSSLAGGLAIGIVGDAGLRAFGKEGKVFISLLLILIFAEALGLYGVIVSLVITYSNGSIDCGPLVPPKGAMGDTRLIG